LLPEANLNSFGGANYRFNNLSIDGSATNDVWIGTSKWSHGSSASGTRWFGRNAASGFGAISALSVKRLFDVTFGNFTGAVLML
jgi:hypothetical protein